MGPPIFDSLPSDPGFNSSAMPLILSPNKSLFHSIFHHFAHYQLSLSRQLVLPGLLPQPPNWSTCSYFCPPTSIACAWIPTCCHSWPKSDQSLPVWLPGPFASHCPPASSVLWRHGCLVFPRPVRPQAFLLKDFLCIYVPFLPDLLDHPDFSSGGPVITAYHPVWISL